MTAALLPLATRFPRPWPGEARPYAIRDVLEHEGCSAAALARAAGIQRRQIERWKVTGLTEAQADHLACRLGVHPSAIWPDWWSWSPSALDHPVTE